MASKPIEPEIDDFIEGELDFDDDGIYYGEIGTIDFLFQKKPI